MEHQAGTEPALIEVVKVEIVAETCCQIEQIVEQLELAAAAVEELPAELVWKQLELLI